MNKKIIIGIILIIILILFFYFLLKGKAPREVTITTNKTEYALNEAPIITIKNNLNSNICLSSCYPYYLEKNNGEWKIYFYEECKESDVVEMCIEPNQAKPLELLISAVPAGLHRVALPVCLNCQIGQSFREDQRFYSNEFTIK